MKTFDLNGNDYIELNKLLKIMGLAYSGGEAGQMIMEGLIRVNGAVEYRKRKKCVSGDRVEYDGHDIDVI